MDAHAALPELPSARVSLHSHDDCYLSLHAKDERVIWAVFTRSLEMHAGTLLGKDAEPDIVPVPEEIANRLWSLPLTLTFLRDGASVDSKTVVVGFSRTEYSFLEKRKYPVDGHLSYVPSTGTWSLEGREKR